MSADPTITPLAWESQFLGVQTGALALDDRCAADDVRHMVGNAGAQGFALVVVSHPADAGLLRAILQDCGARLVDTRMDYAAAVAPPAAAPVGVQPISDGADATDCDALDALALASGQFSRFRLDPLIGEERWRQLYRLWVRNSLSGEIADRVMVHRDGAEITGFVTVKRQDAERARIGLIAVDAAQRGKGVGSGLLAAVHGWAADRGLREVLVATQQANQGACRFYEHAGFSLARQTDTHHLWLRPPPHR